MPAGSKRRWIASFPTSPAPRVRPARCARETPAARFPASARSIPAPSAALTFRCCPAFESGRSSPISTGRPGARGSASGSSSAWAPRRSGSARRRAIHVITDRRRARSSSAWISASSAHISTRLPGAAPSGATARRSVRPSSASTRAAWVARDPGARSLSCSSSSSGELVGHCVLALGLDTGALAELYHPDGTPAAARRPRARGPRR